MSWMLYAMLAGSWLSGFLCCLALVFWLAKEADPMNEQKERNHG